MALALCSIFVISLQLIYFSLIFVNNLWPSQFISAKTGE